MKKWLFWASVDAVNIDFETIIESENEPDFWTCQSLAEENGCDYWSIEQYDE